MKVDQRLFLITVLFYLLLFINPNSKTLALCFFVYFLVVWVIKKNFKTALLLAYLASIPFRVGKTFVMEFVSQAELNIPFRPYGIEATFVIAVKEIFLVAMAFVLFREFMLGNRKALRFDALSLLLFLYFLSMVIASAFGSIRPSVSLLFSLYEIRPLIMYWYIRLLLDTRQKIFSEALAIFAAAMFLQFVLAIFQFIQGGPLGLSIEESRDFSRIESDRELGQFTFRPSGTFFYANWLANYVLLYLVTFVPALFLKTKKQDKIGVYAFIFALGTLLFTLGRSAWLSFFLSISLFFFTAEKIWRIKLKLVPAARQLFLLSLPVGIPLVIFFVLPRLASTFYFFDEGAGWRTRLDLFSEAWRTIQTHFLFGVGQEMDVFYSFSTWRGAVENIFLAFPEPVHNGFLRLAVQSGIFPLIFFVAFSSLIFYRLKQHIQQEKIFAARAVLLAVFLAVGASYFNILAQPMMPNLPEIIFLVVVAGDRYNLHRLTTT